MTDRRVDSSRKSSPETASASDSAPRDRPTAQGHQASTGPRKKKILVVDDSMTSLLSQQLTLGVDTYDILIARNGKEAIAKAVAERPDLILMDVVMPAMDGFQACRWLRAFDATKTVPIIMMTTRSDQTSIKVGFANGCTDYLVKPFDSDTLLKKVRTHLGE
ncbi:transcriptional regulator [Sorangium cellulosum]|uniref:Transcriptional regulator n=1 Tax=Sorangium cellulosum TaxID=56 RepID=A0A4P2PXW3_SORCE|nr:response regulator [Sorangium cellulosum]AUX21659.1 transcriptional regulator [Sorangium cellulosum]